MIHQVLAFPSKHPFVYSGLVANHGLTSQLHPGLGNNKLKLIRIILIKIIVMLLLLNLLKGTPSVECR